MADCMRRHFFVMISCEILLTNFISRPITPRYHVMLHVKEKKKTFEETVIFVEFLISFNTLFK